MPTLHARSNNNISKIWVIVVMLMIAMLFLLWMMMKSINTISENTTESRILIGELLAE